MLRNSLSIDGRDFLLDQGTDIDDLKTRAADAIRAGAGYIDFTIVGNRQVSILLSPGVPVAFESADVDYDSRDTGNLEHPYLVPDSDD